MTHPTGPAGSGPSGGAGSGPKFLPGFLSELRLTRARSEAAAVKAGARGTSAAPMTGTRRLAGYVRQTNRATFTPRQWRRYVHKANRSTVGAT